MNAPLSFLLSAHESKVLTGAMPSGSKLFSRRQTRHQHTQNVRRLRARTRFFALFPFYTQDQSFSPATFFFCKSSFFFARTLSGKYCQLPDSRAPRCARVGFWQILPIARLSRSEVRARVWVEQPPVVVGAPLTIPSESDWKDRAAEIADRFRLTGRAGGAGGRFGSPGHNCEVPDLKSWSVQGEGVILLRRKREDLGQ